MNEDTSFHVLHTWLLKKPLVLYNDLITFRESKKQKQKQHFTEAENEGFDRCSIAMAS